MNAEHELARQWIAKANNDLLNADNNLNAKDVPYDTVCFHCQQAAEKFLKAYLVSQEQPHPFTHDLLLLLERILPFCPDAERLRDDLSLLLPYAVEIRYPDDTCMPSERDATEARTAAANVQRWLQTVIPDIVSTAIHPTNQDTFPGP